MSWNIRPTPKHRSPAVHTLGSQYLCGWQRLSLLQVPRNSPSLQGTHSVSVTAVQSFTSFCPGKSIRKRGSSDQLWESDIYQKLSRLGAGWAFGQRIQR